MSALAVVAYAAVGVLAARAIARAYLDDLGVTPPLAAVDVLCVGLLGLVAGALWPVVALVWVLGRLLVRR